MSNDKIVNIWMNNKGKWLILTESNGHAGSLKQNISYTDDINTASAVYPTNIPKELKGKLIACDAIITRAVTLHIKK